MPQEEFSPWMKVLLNDNLFYYTIVMHTDMQELMWAGECMHSVLSAIIRYDRLNLIQPVLSSARSCVCTVCTVARPAHVISCSLLI